MLKTAKESREGIQRKATSPGQIKITMQTQLQPPIKKDRLPDMLQTTVMMLLTNQTKNTTKEKKKKI